MAIDGEHIILKTEQLSIGYASKKKEETIFSDINLNLAKGNFACILGKNGIGKSTLLRTLSKVQNQLAGEIYINSKNLNDIAFHDLAKTIALVLTERLPVSNLTVFELIALGRQPYTNWLGSLSERDIEVVNQSLSLTKTTSLKDRKFYELSDGQLQRVLIARALAQETEIIILDEPTAHLDVQHKLETFELLKHLANSLNKTIICSTHEIHTALQNADELWLMLDNEFVSGKTQDLINDNKIEKLFNSENVLFDKTTRQFSLKQNQPNA